MASSNWIIPIEWGKGLFTEGWNFPKELSSRKCYFPRLKLWMLPRALDDAALESRFDSLVNSSELLVTWASICGDGTRDKVFLLNFPPSIWDIPWELLLTRKALLINPAQVSLVRTTPNAQSHLPEMFPKKLITLIIKGAQDGPGLDQLDTQSELCAIDQAWQSLPPSAKECVLCPGEARDADEATLPSLLNTIKPDLLWFTGHGEVHEQTQLWFANHTWVSAERLGKLIRASEHCPLYCVFSACSTARPAQKTRRGGPDLFAQLSACGVASILAMQAPISVSAALQLTRNLFENLALGFPLEQALARSRHYLINHFDQNTQNSFDWASPVVWSAGAPVDHLTWDPKAQHLAQLQIYGNRILAFAHGMENEVDAPLSPTEQAQAQHWIQHRYIWITGDPTQSQYRHYWVRTLRAIANQSDLFVVAVELENKTTNFSSITGQWQEALREWANSLYTQLLPGDFGEHGFAQSLDKIRTNQPQGWAELCGQKGMFLSIANPPPYSERWFWNPFLSAIPDGSHAAILGSPDLPPDRTILFEIDKVGQAVDVVVISSAYNEAPRLSRAIAVLNLPMAENYLTLPVTLGDGAGSIKEWPNARILLEKTAASSYFMTATARDYVLQQAQEGQLMRQAHEDCLRILKNPQLPVTTGILESRFNHMFEMGDLQGANYAANRIIEIYFRQNRPYSVTLLADRLKSETKDLNLYSQLILVWAYLKLGQTNQAIVSLDRAEMKTPLQPTSIQDFLNTSWIYGLKAEIAKSQGTEEDSKNKSREAIEYAIEICKSGQSKFPKDPLIRNRLRALLQDRARIKQYLVGDLIGAAKDYSDLVNQWNKETFQGIDLAIVKKNYAACLFNLSRNGQENHVEEAATYLSEAKELANKYPQETVLSEVLYEEGKLAEREGRNPEADILFKECFNAAVISHYSMMQAIVENRIFWRKGPYSPENWIKAAPQWHEIERNLLNFPDHGWAVRTLIDSRLRVAHILDKSGDVNGCLVELDENRKNLDRNPAYNTGTDRGRIARTMAGLQILREKVADQSDDWKVFREKYSVWADDWLTKRGLQRAQDVWDLEGN
jgi:tetratricopeptide (TPR) repeat protein